MNNTTRIPTLSTLRERIAFWWAALPRESVITGLAMAAVLVVVTLFLLSLRSPGPEQAPQPAATQTNPLAPLIARLDALEADVIDLQDRAADLEGLQPRQTTAPRRSAAARTPAEPPQAAQPQPQPPQAPQPSAWGVTDLDRAIDASTPPTTFGAKP